MIFAATGFSLARPGGKQDCHCARTGLSKTASANAASRKANEADMLFDPHKAPTSQPKPAKVKSILQQAGLPRHGNAWHLADCCSSIKIGM